MGHKIPRVQLAARVEGPTKAIPQLTTNNNAVAVTAEAEDREEIAVARVASPQDQ